MKQRDVVDRLEEAKSMTALLRDAHSCLHGSEFLGEISEEGKQGIFWMLENVYNQIDLAEEDLIREGKQK